MSVEQIFVERFGSLMLENCKNVATIASLQAQLAELLKKNEALTQQARAANAPGPADSIAAPASLPAQVSPTRHTARAPAQRAKAR